MKALVKKNLVTHFQILINGGCDKYSECFKDIGHIIYNSMAAWRISIYQSLPSS
jgi:hypothetical protein